MNKFNYLVFFLIIIHYSNLYTQEVDLNQNIEEIVVTAQKKSENLQNVPISVSTLSATELDNLNIKDFADYVLQLPSASATQRRPGQGQIFMRGISDGGNSNQSLQGPAVAIYLDESPVTMIGDNLDVHVYDIERVEALSGPQGTLYGSNAIGGTIRYITKKPDLSGFDYAYSVEYGKKRFAGNAIVNYNAMVNVPLNDLFAIRATYSQSLDPGIYENIITQNS